MRLHRAFCGRQMLGGRSFFNLGAFVNLLTRRPVIILVIITAILRGSVLWIGFNQLHDDPDAYDAIAQTLAATGTFGVVADGEQTVPTAFRPPLYPTILAMLQIAIIAIDDRLEDPLVSGKSPVSRVAIAVLHWVMSVATVAITYFVAWRMLHPSDSPDLPNSQSAADRVTLAAFFAALLVAIDPILIQSSVRVMTETLAALLAVGGLHCWCVLVEKPIRQNGGPAFRTTIVMATGLGVVLGLAYLCRPTFLVWTCLLIAALAIWSTGLMWQSRFRRSHRGETVDSVAASCRKLSPVVAAITLAVVAGLFVGGWTLRNQKRFGKPIWATTHGGYTLLLGNNPSFFDYMRTGKRGIAWDPQPFFDRWKMRDQADPRQIEYWQSETPLPTDPQWQASLRDSETPGELLEDHLAYETAKMAIANDFAGFVRASLWKVGRLLSPMPQVFERATTGKRIGAAAVTIYYSLTLALMIGGIFRLSRNLFQPHWIAAIALVLSLVAVHAFYWSNMRMRAPAIPALAILAAVPLLRHRSRHVARGMIGRKPEHQS
jgi:hypothetical protein